MVIDTTHDVRRPGLGSAPSRHHRDQRSSAEQGDDLSGRDKAPHAVRFVGQLSLWAVIGFVVLALLNTALGGR